ncbi:DUF2924 domain-containing protein [Planktomarina temperata]|nr:DUF2924 domain-containing protein [Planktomarina temperata]
MSEVKGSKDLGIDIAALDTAGRDELLEHWRSLIGRPPPKHISRSLLIQIIAFELQSKQHRGFSKRLSQRLKRAALFHTTFTASVSISIKEAQLF